MNIYLNGYAYNPSDYADLIYLNITSEDRIDEFLYSGAFYDFVISNVSKPLQNNYHENCTRSKKPTDAVCTVKELTYL